MTCRHLADPTTAAHEPLTQGREPRRALERGAEEVGATAGREVGEEPLEEARRDGAPVPASVEREVVPSVRVLAAGWGRQVGWVREDALESARPVHQVRRDGGEVERLTASDGAERAERSNVAVRRDDARPTPCGLEGERARAGADVEQRRPGRDARERSQELGVLAGRVDPRRGR